ncbi:MAG: DUF1320 family protein [Magnetococcales bacterium]|nr:DUF1320 family protein [Magnetococcales bacterium]
MPYATPSDLIAWYGAVEMAQRGASDHLDVVDADLLLATVEGGDRSGWTQERQDAADEALGRMDAALLMATREMGVYLSGRYTLPIDAAVVADSALPRICGDLARWFLYDDGAPPHIGDRYDRANKVLRDIQAGRADLGGASAPSGSGAGMPVVGVGSGSAFSGMDRF